MNNKNLMSNCNPSVKKYSLNKTKKLIKKRTDKVNDVKIKNFSSKTSQK